jgi:hypothetical protein
MTSMNWNTYEDVVLRVTMGSLALVLPAMVAVLVAVAYHILTKACP